MAHSLVTARAKKPQSFLKKVQILKVQTMYVSGPGVGADGFRRRPKGRN